MVSKIKNRFQKKLVQREYRRYEERIAEQDLSYDEWILEKERQERECLSLKGKDLRMEVVSYEECGEKFSFTNYKAADILVFHAPDGTPDMRELALVADYFARHPGTVVLYADEDEIGADGERKNPWLKPDWSPDTLISYFYFGGFFAVRREEGSHVQWLGERDVRRNLYDFALKAVEITGSADHIDSVLFHRSSIEPWGQEESY